MRPRGSAPNDHLKWSAVHRRLLREAYGKADTAVIASVLERTEGAVEEMARTLGLVAPDPRRRDGRDRPDPVPRALRGEEP